MLDAVVGSVIMVVATTSLLFAIELSGKAFRQSGFQGLSPDEEDLVNHIRTNSPSFPDSATFESMNSDLFKLE